MRIVVGVLVLASITAAGILGAGQQGDRPSSASTVLPPPWAYPVNAPGGAGAPPVADDGTPKRVPGSNVALTTAQIRDLFNPPDWHPDDHPSMPEIVGRGRRPEVRACGYCHLPNGQGRPENSSLAGLPVAYIVQQMADYKNGLRKSSEPKMGPPAAMLAIGKSANDAEVKVAAEYFASLKPKQWIRVVEASTVPKTRVAGGMLVPTEGTEPIGQRIIETPEDVARTELRDSKSGFIAYVPVGSIKKGEALVTTGGGKTTQCAVCHGLDLKGLGPVPGIAGRSPSYLVRQMFDMKHGARKGLWSDLMKSAVTNLSEDDMVAIAAYAASRVP